MKQLNPWRSPDAINGQEAQDSKECLFEWQGRQIAIEFEYVPRFFPLFDCYSVAVDGSKLETTTKFSQRSVSLDIHHDGVETTVRIEREGNQIRKRKLRFFFDEQFVHESFVIARNWWAAQCVFTLLLTSFLVGLIALAVLVGDD